jgi:acyl-CoA dehydrogenase
MLNYKSPWMDEELTMFRDSCAKFVETEMLPLDEKWREQKFVDPEMWLEVGEMGMLCMDIPAEYGGIGADFRYEAIFHEEQARVGITGFGQSVHSICAHYLLNHGTEEQKLKYLPQLASGKMIAGIAMTEPGAGSDLQGLKTRAILDGDHYVVNGSKIFISNGILAGLLAVVVKTDPTQGAKGTSILLVETKDLEGYSVAKPLKKAGLHAQDTCEIYFEDVRIPVENLMGAVEGKGFYQLMSDLPYERTILAVNAVSDMEGAIADTITYTKERHAFGKTIFDFQNTRFKLAEVATKAQIARVFVDHCIEKVVSGELDSETAAMAKWWTTDLQQEVADECLQLFGGYGYMDEYTISRRFVDARVQRIYGGSNEIMKEIISRAL